MTTDFIKDWLKIVKVVQETPDTKTIRINLNKPASFIPGQFVMLGLNLDENGEKKLIKRAYSIASSPVSKNYIELTFNIYPKGQLSPHLYRLKKGDEVYVEGPYGKFNFKEETKEAVFLAAGAGVTPLMSMIRYVADKKLNIKCTLLYSVKKPENIIYKKELERLEKNKAAKIFVTVTRPEGTGWKGRTGRINSDMIKELVPSLNNSIFYTCGSPEMVEDMIKILHGLGVDKDRINREQW